MPTEHKNPRRAPTPQQWRFAAEYIKDWKKSNAAIRAGYAKSSAGKTAAELLRHPEIKAYIDAIKAEVKVELRERAVLSSKRTVQLIADMAYFELADFFHPDGSPKAPRELSPAAAAAVQGFKVTKVEVGKGANKRTVLEYEYRLVNKVAAADMAAKVTGEYKADNEQRRNARDMSDDELIARIIELSAGGGTPKDETTVTTPPATPTLQ